MFVRMWTAQKNQYKINKNAMKQKMWTVGCKSVI